MTLLESGILRYDTKLLVELWEFGRFVQDYFTVLVLGANEDATLICISTGEDS